MRFEKGHKEATRRHILDVASKCFRREGIAAAGISGIMGEAGLTNGAFYPHFESKEELVREAVANALAEHQHRLEENLETRLDLEKIIRSYLSLSHRDEGACGCPSAALLPEIARQPELTRKAYADGLRTFISRLAALLPEPELPAASRRATAIFALMVGTLQFARAMPDAKHAKQMLEDGVQAALLLARAPSH
jgi:TetR/AcrR family transcriptional repressor of nem operon